MYNQASPTWPTFSIFVATFVRKWPVRHNTFWQPQTVVRKKKPQTDPKKSEFCSEKERERPKWPSRRPRKTAFESEKQGLGFMQVLNPNPATMRLTFPAHQRRRRSACLLLQPRYVAIRPSPNPSSLYLQQSRPPASCTSVRPWVIHAVFGDDLVYLVKFVLASVIIIYACLYGLLLRISSSSIPSGRYSREMFFSSASARPFRKVFYELWFFRGISSSDLRLNLLNTCESASAWSFFW
jgi:hypothetical protein